MLCFGLTTVPAAAGAYHLTARSVMLCMHYKAGCSGMLSLGTGSFMLLTSRLAILTLSALLRSARMSTTLVVKCLELRDALLW